MSEDKIIEANETQALKSTLRIGASMLFVAATLGIIFLTIALMLGGASIVGAIDFITPIINIIIGINLWRAKERWKRFAIWWIVISLVLSVGDSLVAGDYSILIAQIGFSVSLLILLTGIPSKSRTVTAVIIYFVLYLGVTCLVFTLSFLQALPRTG